MARPDRLISSCKVRASCKLKHTFALQTPPIYADAANQNIVDHSKDHFTPLPSSVFSFHATVGEYCGFVQFDAPPVLCFRDW